MFSPLSVALAVPLYIDPEEIEVGRAVFHHFVHDEFEHVGMSDQALIEQNQNQPDEIIDEHLAIAHGIVFGDGRPSTPEGYKNILINNIGGSIRELANEFAQSSQREQIRIHADTVDLGHINQERFWGLLQEVFRDGVNVYNIVALFYFCSDVLIRCVKQQLYDLGINLFKWSLNYIADKVCRWAQNHGGWEKALRKVITKRYFVYCTAAVIGLAVAWGLYKGLKS